MTALCTVWTGDWGSALYSNELSLEAKGYAATEDELAAWKQMQHL